MLTFNRIIIIAFSFALSYSCANSSAPESVETQQDGIENEKSGPEYTSAYICPMYCEGSGSEEPGKCPVCGMDYVLNENM
jgi:predicted nucleic acid binding AN1-type Zn finger protein